MHIAQFVAAKKKKKKKKRSITLAHNAFKDKISLKVAKDMEQLCGLLLSAAQKIQSLSTKLDPVK